MATLKRKRVEEEVPPTLLGLMEDTPDRMTFDPTKHLNFHGMPQIHTMEEIALPDVGISDVAVSEPFSLFTAEAIKQMRAEILSEPVLKNCKYSSNLAHSQLRGFAPEYVIQAVRSEISLIAGKICTIRI